jgi:predicted lysophospholipase L1 biosynthesis ABC-type transport system permease subunit
MPSSSRLKGRALRERVAAIRKLDRIGNVRLGLIFPCRAFEGFNPIFEAGIRVAAGQEAAVRRTFAEKFPWVPVMSRDETGNLIQRSVQRGITIIRLMSTVLIACGALIMTLLLNAQKRGRVAEVAIWKALGGTRRAVSYALAGEMAIVGALSGLAGCAGGVIFSSLFISFMLAKTSLVWAPLGCLGRSRVEHCCHDDNWVLGDA